MASKHFSCVDLVSFVLSELNDFIIQLDEEVEGMQSTILVLQQQLRDTKQQLCQQTQSSSSSMGPSRTSPSSPGTVELSTPAESVPVASSSGSKDCDHVFNGPSNGNSSQRATSSSGPYREGSSADEDYPASPSASSPTQESGPKISNHSEGVASQDMGEAFGTQLSTGYESVDSPTGSEASMTLHSNDTDSNADSHEAAAVSKSNRTTRHTAQNGLESTAATPASNSSTGSVL